MDKEITKVIFKIFDDEVIAVFPEEIWGYKCDECSSYMHVGHHGAVSVGFMKKLSNATPEKYYSLFTELQSIGYNLNVCKRFTSKMDFIRHSKVPTEYK